MRKYRTSPLLALAAIGVGIILIVAVVGWFYWNATTTVTRRREALNWLRAQGGTAFQHYSGTTIDGMSESFDVPDDALPWVRRRLGDQPVAYILLPYHKGFPLAEALQLSNLFPECERIAQEWHNPSRNEGLPRMALELS